MNDAFRSAQFHMLELDIVFKRADRTTKDYAYYSNMSMPIQCHPTPWRRRFRGRIRLF
jgi:hypothetical protein